jgi:hypothetical protein
MRSIVALIGYAIGLAGCCCVAHHGASASTRLSRSNSCPHDIVAQVHQGEVLETSTERSIASPCGGSAGVSVTSTPE